MVHQPICLRARLTPPGADVGTMPYKVIEQLTKHPLTDSGLKAFLKDWENMRQ